MVVLLRCAPASPQKRPPATERAGEALSTAQASRSCRRRDGLPWGGGGEGWRAVAGRRGGGHRVGGHARFHATATAVPHGHGPSARVLSPGHVSRIGVFPCVPSRWGCALLSYALLEAARTARGSPSWKAGPALMRCARLTQRRGALELYYAILYYTATHAARGVLDHYNILYYTIIY